MKNIEVNKIMTLSCLFFKKWPIIRKKNDFKLCMLCASEVLYLNIILQYIYGIIFRPPKEHIFIPNYIHACSTGILGNR